MRTKVISAESVSQLNTDIENKEKAGWTVIPESLAVATVETTEPYYGKKVVRTIFSIVIQKPNSN